MPTLRRYRAAEDEASHPTPMPHGNLVGFASRHVRGLAGTAELPQEARRNAAAPKSFRAVPAQSRISARTASEYIGVGWLDVARGVVDGRNLSTRVLCPCHPLTHFR